jgi:site-specific DNA-adenine methylase
MDRFIINYNGNKYNESKKYLCGIDYSKFDFIVEPFCGIFGFSRFVSLRDFNGMFLLNDIDKELITFYNELKNNYDDTISKYENEWKENIKPKSYILQLMGKAQFNIYNHEKCLIKINNFKEMKDKYRLFLGRCLFHNMDYREFVETLKEKYGENNKYLLYFDPPYIYSHNSTYKYTKDFDNKVEHLDESKIYIDILKYFDNYDCMLVTNKLCLLDYLFGKYTYVEYGGTYQRTKNIKKHIVYLKITT